MEENILISTKGCYGRCKYFVTVIISLICSLVFTWGFSFIFFGQLYYLLLIISTAFWSYPTWRAWDMSNSYIDLYEDYVSGQSVSDKYYTASNACIFKLYYTQITHLEILKGQDIIKIYFNGGSYLVQAKGCEEKVEKLIREHQTKYKKQADI